jgi:hypothetical protein
MTTTDPLAVFADLDIAEDVAAEMISTVLDRWRHKPSPYRDYAQYSRTLAGAYAARAAVFSEAIDRAIEHGPDGVLLGALSMARIHCENEARDLIVEAQRFEREEANRAWRSYEPNLAVAS